MLFRPVYGPELEVIYSFIAQSQTPVSRQAIYQACLPSYVDMRAVMTQSIDDALSFLVAALLVVDQGGFRLNESGERDASFRLTVIAHMQKLASGKAAPLHKLDALYFLLLQELFIKPDHLYISNVHAEANKLRPVAELGGISQEKIRSWKRVMTFLGLGQRLADGFQCVYTPGLLLEIIAAWPVKEGFIQDFLEGYLIHYLPCQTQAGDMPQAVEHPLQYLQSQQTVQLRAYQDASSKPYFGEQRWRYLVYKGDKA
jgi:hypothetical protein